MVIQKKYLALCLSATLLSACGGSDSSSAPIFNGPYALTVAEDTVGTLPVTATDADGDTLTYSVSNQAANGTVAINASSGVATYTPNTNFHGADSFVITVSDGGYTTTTTVSVTITPVNDAPEFTSTEVFVSGGETKTGQIPVIDVDGDTLTYTLVIAPQNGTLVVGPATGAISYIPNELIDVNDTFTVRVSDGQASVEQELTLVTNLASNTDRAYYYYASAASHLKRAEALITDLADDVNKNIVYSSMAEGYASAALDVQAEKYLDSSYIVADNTRANALVAVANQYNLLGRIAEGDELRQQAKALYNAYLSTKGISSFDSTDASFYSSLADSYYATGNTTETENVYDILDSLFADALATYSTAAARTYNAFRSFVVDEINAWATDPTTERYERSVRLAERLHSYANIYPYQEVASGVNTGRRHYAGKATALGQIIGYFIQLNHSDNAKKAMADQLALYGIVNYDPAYPRTADIYAEGTRPQFAGGVTTYTDEYAMVYPDIALSTYLYTGLTTAQITTATNNYNTGKVLGLVRNAPDGATALAAVQASRNESNLRLYFTNLITFNNINNRSSDKAAMYRFAIGDYAGVDLFLDEALTLIQSEAYITQNLSQQQYVAGHVGCHFLIQLGLKLAEADTANSAAHQTKTQNTTQTCVNLAQQYYANGVDGTSVRIKDAAQANSEVIKYLAPLEMNEQITTILATAEANLLKYTESETDLAEHQSSLQLIATSFYQGGRFSETQPYFDRAITLAGVREAAATDDELGLVTTDLFDEGSRTYEGFIDSLRNNAGLLENYPELLATATSKIVALFNNTLEKLDTASQQTQLTYIPKIADDLAALHQYEQALALREKAVFGTVEKASITTSIAKRLAVHDDFPATIVASVDTDKDGLPNFFAAFATDEDIAASGLTLDPDSDNDGATDTEDAYPLDPTQQ